MAQAVLGLASPPALRQAHAALAVASATLDARARHLGQLPSDPTSQSPDAHRRRGGRPHVARRLMPPRSTSMRVGRHRLSAGPTSVRPIAAECLFIDLSRWSVRQHPRDRDRDAPPGPARAVLSTARSLLPRTRPEAVTLGEQALWRWAPTRRTPGEDPGRVAFSSCSSTCSAGSLSSSRRPSCSAAR